MSQHIDLNARTRAVKACKQKFENQCLDWGRADCVKLAALAMLKQGITGPLLRGVRYSSEATALKRLQDMNCASLGAAMDATGLVRIAPARALPGDILGLPSLSPDWDVALAIVETNRAAFGFFGPDHRGQSIRPLEIVCAWRVA